MSSGRSAASPALRFLVVDDDAKYRELLRYHVGAEWPDAHVDEHAPQGAQPGAASIAPGSYDLILLGHPLRHETGFEWLEGLRARPRCPPVVVFASPSNELLAVDALKAGASSFFPKQPLSHARLAQTLRCELETAGRLGPAREPLDTSDSSLPRGYRYLETLHAGELASVFRVEGPLGVPIALKVIRCGADSGTGYLFERFLQEYELIARLYHPNVVRIHDLGVTDDRAFIAMEYLASGRLSDHIGQLPPGDVVPCMYQIASGLRAVHGAGVLHRDLKPTNIMFRDADTVALIDFGLAKCIELGAAITDTGRIFGTPYYMSPEQGHADRIDERSDIYSLGCIFYEMLTGRRPFTARSAMGVIYKHSHAERPPLGDGHARFEPLLERMMAVEPDARPQSASALLDEIAAL